MAVNSNIEWTDATWNPVIGCKRVSEGCDHCYAFQLHDQRHIAWKRGRFPNAPEQYHVPFSTVQLMYDRLMQPTTWRSPRRVFVNSMSDLFHEDVPFGFIGQVWQVMADTPQHTYQILTKRPERMLAFVQKWAAGDDDYSWPTPAVLPNVWLGVSVENQQRADERIPLLLQTPAALRFISAEPLLGAISCYRIAALEGPYYDFLRGEIREVVAGEEGVFGRYLGGLDWVIAGGESGPRHRPVNLAWLRSLRDQCVHAGVPFFLKQIGGRTPKAGGHALDGVEWRQFPSQTAVQP